MKRILLSTALALAIGGAVQAQGLPEIQSAIESGIAGLNDAGGNLSFSATAIEDGAVVLRDVVLAPGDGSLVIEAAFLRVAPAPGLPGQVVVTVPPTVTLTATPSDGTPPMEMTLASEGLELTTNTLAGPVTEAGFLLTADSLRLTGGADDHPVLKALDIAPEGLRADIAFDTLRRDARADMTFESLLMAYTVANPENGSVSETYTEAGPQKLRFSATGLPESEADFESFLATGSMSLEMSGGSSVTRFSSNDPEMPISIEGSGEGGNFELAVENGAVRYLAAFDGIAYTLTPDPTVLPLPPFDMKVETGSMTFAMPLAPSEEIRNANFGFALKGLEASESVWGMIDPGATIPRDPATLEIDVSADVRLDTPLGAAAETENPMEIGEVINASIDRLFLSLGGATVEAGGAVVMDNSGPIPIPNGSVDVMVSGLQGLGDKLAALGLVDQMEVAMMMGMIMNFAEPTGVPDSFRSKIEFRDGGILANGKQIQ